MPEETLPSSSRVGIQCSGSPEVFDVFQERLESRAPLKSLHWKSASRPLRSIASLNISIVKKDPLQNGSQPGARRHQIPGLRETPYVKLYLLRCDDKDMYKETSRKEIKQWIRENTFEKESKAVLRNQEHHDAFEWMIVHVVLPGTQASSQPQSSKHISLHDTESTDSVNSKSKWTGKATSTIYDKLRADFSSSKLAVPRVAQVRILDPSKPPGALGPTDVEEQWRDFVDNLKASILKSFDTRVAQYEEDIKEREAQRSLPGWNFCTFFILKEGLARGFESVGLLEDALAVYSELEVGLDTVVKDTDAEETDVTGALLPHSSNLKTIIRQALEVEPEGIDDDDDSPIQLTKLIAQRPGTSPFDAERRKYREMILSNDVSPLDVRTYIFIRQLEILLRRARIVPADSRSKLDFDVLADLAELALNFINLGSRELRMDMQTAWGGRLSGEERAIQKVVIGNVVASWTWAAVMQMLSYLLPHVDLDLKQFNDADDILEEEDQLEKKTRAEHLREASRTSSPYTGLETEPLSSDNLNHESHDNKKPTEPRRPGLDRLYSMIAKLFLLARKIMENLPAVTAWLEEVRQVNSNSTGKIHLHRLSSDFGLSTMNRHADNHLPDAVEKYRQRALDPRILRQATASRESFHQIFDLMSKVMHHLFVRAGSQHSARQVLIDLAMLAFARGNRAFTRQCISTILKAGSGEPIVTAQPHVLAMYAECLRSENRPGELASCLIAMLQVSGSQSVEYVQKLCSELADISQRISELVLPLRKIASLVRIDRTIVPSEGTGGFTMSLLLQGNPAAVLPCRNALLRLKAMGQDDPQSILLKGPTSYELSQQSSQLLFRSNVSANGWYEIEELELRIGNLRFVHDFHSAQSLKSVAEYAAPLSPSQAEPVLLYVSSASPSISVLQSMLLDLEKAKSLAVPIDLCGLDVDSCSLLIRPATAGLRLNLLDVTCTSEAAVLKSEHDSRGTIINLIEIRENAKISLDIPYTLESPGEPVLSLKCLLEYHHDGRSYSVYQRCSVDAKLPISVSVQDIYRTNHWYSTFLLSTMLSSPIELTDCQLDHSEDIVITQPAMPDTSTTIFAQQPTKWMVQLQKRTTTSGAPLKLKIKYRRIDDVAVDSLRRSFLSSADDAGLSLVADVLSDHLIATTRQRWSEEDLELIGLTHEVARLHRTDMNWEQILPAFSNPTRERIRQWLTQWHADEQTIQLDFDRADNRELRLKVDVRSPPPVIATSLKVHLLGDQTTAVLGQPMMCTLTIDVPQMEATRVAYELFAPSDAWLVGGRKKGIISGRQERQSVALFPQKTGRLLLPVINIRCRKSRGPAPPIGDDGEDIPVEVHNRSISQSIQVTPNLRSSILGLASVETGSPAATGAMGGSGLLLQSQMRSQSSVT